MSGAMVLNWGAAPANAQKALNAAARPLERILRNHGFGEILDGNPRNAAVQLVQMQAIRAVFVLEKRTMSEQQRRTELAMISDVQELAAELAKRLRLLRCADDAALANDVWDSPASELFRIAGQSAAEALHPEAALRMVEAITHGAQMVTGFEKERSKSRLPANREQTARAVRSLAKLWERTHRQKPISESGAPKAAFVRLVEEWETEAGRGPGPQPRSIRLYLRNLAWDFPC